jgi:hypothetical protein
MVEDTKSGHPATPRHHPTVPRRQIVAQIVVSAVILVSGIAIGSGGTILALRDRIVPVFRTTSSGGAVDDPNKEVDRWTHGAARRFQDDYELTDQQTQQVQEVLAQGFATTQELWKEFHKAEQAQHAKFAQAMQKILTPEQFTKWREDFEQMTKHMRQMRPFGPRRGRGGPPGDRGDWRPPGPPPGDRDPNGPRDEWRRFKGPDGPRGDWPRERFMDPNGPRGPRPPDWPEEEPNDRPPNVVETK